MRKLSCVCGAVALMVAGQAWANGLETPEAGTAQLGRAGAWLARADDPLSAFFNPAAMVRNPSGAHIGTHLMFRSHCFERLAPDGQPVSPGSTLNPAPGPVCAEISPFPNPQVGASFHFAKRWAIGVAVLGPHKHGRTAWPDVIQYPNKIGIPDAEHPAPQRYMLLEDDALLVYPTVSASFAILKNLSIGAGFVWGVAKFSFSSMSAAVSTSQEEFKNDLKAKISGFDGFIPGFVVSMLYSPLRRLDLAAWYHFSDAIRSEVDLFAQANYYNQGGRINEQAINDPANITDKAKVGSFKARIPMEARLGLRYHHPRSKYAENRHTHPWVDKHGGYARDAMAQDLFDVELDMSWSHNSAVEAIEIRMQRDVRINGTPGYLPENADSPRQWRDVLGVRVGGEYVVIPDFLALRAGGFFESKGVDDAFLSLDFHQGFKAGVAGGVTVRITRVDISAAYQHTFFGALDNGGKGQVRGLSGDATTNYRTTQFVNGGRATSSLNEVALGVTVHF